MVTQQCGGGSLKPPPHTFSGTAVWSTLLCDLDLSAAKVGLFDVLDAEVAVSLGVLLLFVPRRRLIVRAVRVRRRCGRNRTQKCY